MDHQYFCGWDGGGTKTEVCLVNEEGAMIACRSFGPLNINGASQATVRQSVRDAVDFMASQPGGLSACGGLVIGMAGASNQDAVRLMESAVRNAGYQSSLHIRGDQEIALEGAVQGHGAVLIAGTGAICFGRDPAGNRFRVGGYGYLIDDGGSGYAIGRDILAAAARAVDGRGPDTCLKDMVFDALHVQDMPGVITWLYGPQTGKKEIAALAPLLLPALEAGDKAAHEIAEKAAADLAELVLAGWRKTGMLDGELALTGSILTRYAPIRSMVEDKLRAAFPALHIQSPRASAAQGAAMLAMRECLNRN